MDNPPAPSPEEEDLRDRSTKKVDVPNPVPESPSIPSLETDQGQSKTDEHNQNVEHQINPQVSDMSRNPPTSSCFGPWMLAKKPQRRFPKSGNGSSNREGGNLGSKSIGSRFEVLQSDPATYEEPVETPQPSPFIPINQPPLPTKDSQSIKAKNNKKDPLRKPGTRTSKQPSANTKSAATPKVKPSKAISVEPPSVSKKVISDDQAPHPIDQELQKEKRQKELDMLDLMRKHQARLKEQYLNGGNIVDILGGSSNASFWGPPEVHPTVPVHPLAPDIKEPVIDGQSASPQQDQDSHMEDDPSSLQTKPV
ncbi:hypothetical protein SESBI_08339 [Sesbania bispinosa]|nr:hypothetical protein SESBI_08339 [Sesbania bispinosa]